MPRSDSEDLDWDKKRRWCPIHKKKMIYSKSKDILYCTLMICKYNQGITAEMWYKVRFNKEYR